MQLRRRPWRRVPMLVAVGVGLLLPALWPPGRATAATSDGPAYYLDVGGSASVGFQPTSARPHGQPTGAGYADDLVREEQALWPGLQLEEVGCPGATTTTVLDGGGHCPYPDGTQLATGVDFLHTHHTVLASVDLGFNDVRTCIAERRVDDACVEQSIDVVDHQLPEVLAALRAAGGPGLRIVGIGHYDPYLGAYLRGPSGRVLAAQSLGAISQLDQALHGVYAAAGVPMADVAGTFDTTSDQATMMAGVGMVPRNVARTCALTWMCVPRPYGPNQHPNDEGYRLISQAIRSALSGG